MHNCQRQLAYGYIVASHNAQHPDRREAYLLKQLQSLPAWQGSIVHRVLATDFFDRVRAGRPFDAEALTATAVGLARRQFAFSEAHRSRLPGQTKSAAGDVYCALFEHEHDLSISEERLQTVHATLGLCFDHLAAQTEFLALATTGTGHVAEPPLTFRVDAATVAATPDLVFRSNTGRVTIVDWKVGGSDTSDYSRQLRVYALAVIRCGRWQGVAAENVDLYEVNLLKNRVQRHSFEQRHIDETEDFIFRSLVERDALIGDGGFMGLDWDALEVAAKPTTCQYCNFAPLCIRQLAAANVSIAEAVMQGRLV